MFSRHDGSLLRRIGDTYPYDGCIHYPRCLTFVPSVSVYARGACHLAVADMSGHRVSVFDIATAQFIRHVNVTTARHKILNPTSVAFSSAGEMVLTQTYGCGGTVISADGSEARTLYRVPSGMYELSNAVIRDGAIYRYVHVRSYTGHHEDGIYKIQ